MSSPCVSGRIVPGASAGRRRSPRRPRRRPTRCWRTRRCRSRRRPAGWRCAARRARRPRPARSARGHRGGQLAHDGVLLGDARQQHAPGDDHDGQRAEDEHRAERVRRDALRAGVRVVEQRQLVGGDGADHADGREAARQEAGRVHDDEDRDLLDGRVEAARGVDGEGGADERGERAGAAAPRRAACASRGRTVLSRP